MSCCNLHYLFGAWSYVSTRSRSLAAICLITCKTTLENCFLQIAPRLDAADAEGAMQATTPIIDDEKLRRDLVPHIRHVLECQRSLEQRFNDNRSNRSRLWPVMESRMTSKSMAMCASFAFIYAQNGH